MSQTAREIRVPPPIIALVGWILPGAGYWLLGQWARGTVVFVAILTLFASGLLIAGVRVIEVPGYDARGNMITVGGQWIVTHGGLMSEVSSKPWFVCQILAGPMCLASAAGSIELARHGSEYPRVHAPLETVGTLYTAIAGMLNLMVIIDAVHRAGEPAPVPQEAS
jgi:hypothetical protein